jgi:hypothetical protein
VPPARRASKHKSAKGRQIRQCLGTVLNEEFEHHNFVFGTSTSWQSRTCQTNQVVQRATRSPITRSAQPAHSSQSASPDDSTPTTALRPLCVLTTTAASRRLRAGGKASAASEVCACSRCGRMRMSVGRPAMASARPTILPAHGLHPIPCASPSMTSDRRVGDLVARWPQSTRDQPPCHRIQRRRISLARTQDVQRPTHRRPASLNRHHDTWEVNSTMRFPRCQRPICCLRWWPGESPRAGHFGGGRRRPSFGLLCGV